jgi:N-acylneuraminate cytidylyltransferase
MNTPLQRTVVALIPARGGSKRVPGKNIRVLNGHPLLAYTVAAALQSAAFTDVVVSTEDEQTADIARRYGASVPFQRPKSLSEDLAPDIGWVSHALGELRGHGAVDAFAVLRPTSPLRRSATIRAAVAALLADPDADSLRAVEPASQHPGKMWTLSPDGTRMTPLLDDGGADPPWHSSPYQSLPVIHVQNASLEVAWSRTVDEHGSIAGRSIRPWISEGFDGFDINTESDWDLLIRLLERGIAVLPTVTAPPRRP